MYSAKKNVQILVALLKEHGVRHAVISPGSRNMALTISLQSDPYFTCYSVVDERSAAYFAIGVSLAKDEPVMISSTSAQATRNYIPGMTEAYYRGVPLLIVTADYRPSMIGQGVMQTVEQLSIPIDSAKRSFALPIVHDRGDEAFCARQVNEALLELRHHGSGPVHINIPIDDHWDGGVTELPRVRKLDRYALDSELPPIPTGRIMLAIGQHDSFTDYEIELLEKFSDRYDAVLYTNHLSNYRGTRAVHGNLLLENLASRKFAALRPDVVITLGGQPGDYAFADMMRRIRAQHWRVHEDGRVQDTYGKLRAVFEMTGERFLAHYVDVNQGSEARDEGFRSLWSAANAKRTIPEDLPLSHAAIAARLAPRLATDSVVHFAILSALRNWNFFEMDRSIQAYSNVAGFGIDGCMSTFIGSAMASDRPHYLVIGDLSFFYDMNSLGIRGVSDNARIILVNNSGGGEFRLYSHVADTFGDSANEYIAAAGHFGSARAWAESMGWHYASVRDISELDRGLDELFKDHGAPQLLEVVTTMQDDSEGVRRILESNTVEDMERKIARKLSPDTKRMLKRVLGR